MKMLTPCKVPGHVRLECSEHFENVCPEYLLYHRECKNEDMTSSRHLKK